jgi:hypothetical protein
MGQADLIWLLELIDEIPLCSNDDAGERLWFASAEVRKQFFGNQS